MAETYGTIGILPLKEWNATTQYDLLNLVSYNGSSYVAHTRPPVGTLPTNTSYWQVSAQGGNKATANTLGVVKPDGTTTTVNADGAISAKPATQNTAGIVKGGSGVKVESGGALKVDTTFTQATALANIVANEAFPIILGKVSKAIATTMNLNQNALLKNMLTSIDVNDANKIPTSAYIHTLVERIGMGTDLTAGDNLTAAVENLNRDLDPFKGGINALGKYTSLNQMLKNGYYYIPSEVAANYTGYLIVAGYEDSGGTIRKTQYLIQDAGFKWRTVSGTLVSPSFGEWRIGVSNSDLPYKIRTGSVSVETGGAWVSKSISFTGFSSPPEIFLTPKITIGGVPNNVSMSVQVQSANTAVIYTHAQGDIYTFDISWEAVGI